MLESKKVFLTDSLSQLNHSCTFRINSINQLIIYYSCRLYLWMRQCSILFSRAFLIHLLLGLRRRLHRIIWRIIRRNLWRSDHRWGPILPLGPEIVLEKWKKMENIFLSQFFDWFLPVQGPARWVYTWSLRGGWRLCRRSRSRSSWIIANISNASIGGIDL